MELKRMAERLNSVPVRKKAKQLLAVTLAVLMVNPITGYGFAAQAQETQTITAFGELSEEIASQQLAVGAKESDIQLPDTLNVTMGVSSTDTTVSTTKISTGAAVSADSDSEQITSEEQTLKGITWELDAENSISDTFDSSKNGNYYTYLPVLPEGYTLAKGVSLPEISVGIGSSKMLMMDSEATVSINTVVLEEGKYYNQAVAALDNAPTDGTPYLHYSGGVLTVMDAYQISSNLGPAISIDGGTLTIAGKGSLTFESNSAAPCVSFAHNAELVLSGSVELMAKTTTTAPVMAYGSFRTADDYSGYIKLEGNNTVLTQMKEIDLKTTGKIDIISNVGSSSPIVSCEGSIQMTGQSIAIQNENHSASTSNGILVSAGKDVSMTATEGGVDLTASSDKPILDVGGNITLSAVQNVSVLNYNSDKPGVYWAGSKFTITQSNNAEIYGMISGTGDQPTMDIQTNTDVQLLGGILLGSEGTCVVNGPNGFIEIAGYGGDRPVFSGKALTLDANKNIFVHREDDDGSKIPLVYATKQQFTSKNGVVIVSGSTESTIKTKDGQTIQAIFGMDVTEDGLNLSTPPTFPIFCLAGEGYILYTPAQEGNPAVLELTDATIETMDETAIELPDGDVTIKLKGKNKLYSNEGYGITGDSSLTINSTDGGTLDIDSMEIAMQFMGEQNSSTITIGGNASVTSVSHNSVAVLTSGNLTVEPTAKFTAKGMMVDVTIVGNFLVPNFNGSRMGVNQSADPKTFDITVYGTCDMPGAFANEPVGTTPKGIVSLHIPSGSQMTIPVNKSLLVMDMTKLTLEGNIINNGMLYLPAGTTVEQIKAMSLSGTGSIFVPEGIDEGGNPSTSGEAYTNDGRPLKLVEEDLDFNITTEIPASENKGYAWTKSGEGESEVWTLSLTGVAIQGAVTLPENKAITIQCGEDSMINGNIQTGGYECNLTFTGSGSLNIGGGIYNAVGGTVTLKDGAQLTVEQMSFGGSGNSNSNLNIFGQGTTLIATNTQGIAVSVEAVDIEDGGKLIAKADEIGVKAGGVKIGGGSTLMVSCTYGVYITDGMLAMDENSKLITNGSVAPFCIVDTASTSTLDSSAVLSLAGIPSGMEIASVKGAVTGYTFWSLVKTGGSLQVTNENNLTAVTLTGAVQGEKLDFSKPIPTYAVTVQNDGNGTASATSASAKPGTEITLTAAPKDGYKFKEWQVISGGVTITDNKFTMPNGEVTVKAVFESTPIDNNDMHNIIVQNDGNGTAGTTPTSAKQGTQITLTAAPKDGYKFKEWQVISGSVAITANKFIMPNGEVTVKAVFETASSGNNGGNNSGNGGNNGGSNGASPSDGSTSNIKTPDNPVPTTIPADKQTETATVAKQSIFGMEQSRILTIHINDKMAKDSIKAAQDMVKKSGKTADGIAVEFTAGNATGYQSLVVNIDGKAIERLKAANVKFIKIGSSIFDITLDTQSIAKIDKQSSGMVTISAMKQTKLSNEAKKLIGNRPVFNVTVSYQKNGKTKYVSNFGKGVVTLGIAYKATSNENKGYLFGVYVDKNGKPQLLTNSSYDNTGRVIFSRNSLSTYGVGYKDSASVITSTTSH